MCTNRLRMLGPLLDGQTCPPSCIARYWILRPCSAKRFRADALLHVKHVVGFSVKPDPVQSSSLRQEVSSTSSRSQFIQSITAISGNYAVLLRGSFRKHWKHLMGRPLHVACRVRQQPGGLRGAGGQSRAGHGGSAAQPRLPGGGHGRPPRRLVRPSPTAPSPSSAPPPRCGSSWRGRRGAWVVIHHPLLQLSSPWPPFPL